MANFKIGDRVSTPHGKGRIKAFAAWDLTGDEYELYKDAVCKYVYYMISKEVM